VIPTYIIYLTFDAERRNRKDRKGKENADPPLTIIIIND
jgi:hypothetical protein